MKCKVSYCSKDSVALGYCHKHYRAFRLYGDPNAVKKFQFHGKTVNERFFAYVGRRDSCWIWVGYKDPNGYGRLNVDGYPKLASRVSWEVHHGAIPVGMCICHKCDNPSCVNPEHLFIGTQADNVADMHMKGRARKVARSGEHHGNAKLTDDKIAAIRASGESVSALSKRFGVSRATIDSVIKRKTWQHVN